MVEPLFEKGLGTELEAMVFRAPPGAEIRLKAGIYRLERPLFITKPLSLIGDGIQKTRIVCSTEECVLKFLGKGRFRAEGVAFYHLGRKWGDVVVVENGEVDFKRCRFVGGAMEPLVSARRYRCVVARYSAWNHP